MIICSIIACVIVIFSIFAFFGAPIHITGYKVLINVFDVMFGEYNNKPYAGMVILFILQLTIMLFALIELFLCYKVKFGDTDEFIVESFSVVTSIFSLVALILSFCTINLLGIKDSGVSLGAGPITYSIMHIVAIILYIVGIFVEEDVYSNAHTKYKYNRNYNPRNIPNPLNKPVNNTNKTVLSENQKIELILNYKKMLDEGILTQEEFDKKKKEIL